MSQSQFKFERKSGGVSRKLKQAGNVSKIREFELEKVNYMYLCIVCLKVSTVMCSTYPLLTYLCLLTVLMFDSKIIILM